MRNDLLRAARLLVLPTLAFLSVLAFLPGRAGLAVRMYALVLCGTALVVAVAALRRAYPPSATLRPKASPRRARRYLPETLERVEQEVALGVAGSFDLHHLLRPRLRRLASELLLARSVSLDGEPERARLLIGDETWELVRKDRPRPEDRLARGIPLPALRRIVDSLERV